jgi:hypothetical protein
MAKAKAETAAVEIAKSSEAKMVEVEHAHVTGEASYFGKGFRVFFVDGKATVTEEIANVLKEAQLIK